jgi:hypothetical protein
MSGNPREIAEQILDPNGEYHIPGSWSEQIARALLAALDERDALEKKNGLLRDELERVQRWVRLALQASLPHQDADEVLNGLNAGFETASEPQGSRPKTVPPEPELDDEGLKPMALQPFWGKREVEP